MKNINITLLLATMVFFLFSCSREEDSALGDRPSIRMVSPALAFPGEEVTITGLNFGNSSSIEVFFEEKSVEIVSSSAESIVVIVPSISPTDKETARVQVKVDDRKSNQYLFRYDYAQPILDEVPLTFEQGEAIELKGSGFGERLDQVNVLFGGIPATISSLTDEAIELKVPDYAGRVKVDVVVTVKAKSSEPVSARYTNVSYKNPVFAESRPDPTVIKAQDGWFYLYATEDVRNMPIMRSKDLATWESVGTAFTDVTRPTFEPNGGLWAPDINYINGKYVLYYSMSVWGGEQTCGIGVAIADSPQGPFVDKGKLFRSNEIGVQNSIDPNYVEDDGKKYLFWGSFRGIYMIELSDDGLSVKTGAVKKQVAGTYFEGVYVHKRDGYYYMFASIGSCCNGVNSTYQLIVARATNLAGPYYNKSGYDMMNEGRTLILDKNATFVGNGHCSEIVQDAEGKDWVLYHGIQTSNPNGRVLLLDEVKWDDAGWPYFTGGSPSLTAPVPVF